MGHCCSKGVSTVNHDSIVVNGDPPKPAPTVAPSSSNGIGSYKGNGNKTPGGYSFSGSPCPSPYPAGIMPSPATTPGRSRFRWPFPPPSPARPIMSAILKRRGGKEKQPKEGTIPEDDGGGGGHEEEAEGDLNLDKSFGYAKNFGAKYELGKEVGRGHFGNTCWAKCKKGEHKGLPVAVKIISKDKMTTAISIEDVRREVKILKALSEHKNMVKFYDAFEDTNSVYIFMELCEGGELLDRILARGGRYTEEDAKAILVQILSVMAFCHLQGVVHRDLKPENFLFTTKEENAPMKVIDFGLSDFIRTDRRLNDIVGSAYYVAPEVLHRSYSVEADMWSIGVITYILLCGSRPFWARTESGIFRSVLRANPNYNDSPWPSVSPEGRDFVRRLLNKDDRKRMTAAQALTHPWLRDEKRAIPLDILIYKLVKSYVLATPLKRAALKALGKGLTEDELVYLRAQFSLLEPTNGCISLENFRVVSGFFLLSLARRHYKYAMMKTSTDAMNESKVPDILNSMEALSYKKMDFEEFCSAAISTYQLEALEGWEKILTKAFEQFELEGNRPTSAEELAHEMKVGPTWHYMFNDWIRTSDRKLSFLGYTKFLHGVTIHSTRRQR